MSSNFTVSSFRPTRLPCDVYGRTMDGGTSRFNKIKHVGSWSPNIHRRVSAGNWRKTNKTNAASKCRMRDAAYASSAGVANRVFAVLACLQEIFKSSFDCLITCLGNLHRSHRFLCFDCLHKKSSCDSRSISSSNCALRTLFLAPATAARPGTAMDGSISMTTRKQEKHKQFRILMSVLKYRAW